MECESWWLNVEGIHFKRHPQQGWIPNWLSLQNSRFNACQLFVLISVKVYLGTAHMIRGNLPHRLSGSRQIWSPHGYWLYGFSLGMDASENLTAPKDLSFKYKGWLKGKIYIHHMWTGTSFAKTVFNEGLLYWNAFCRQACLPSWRLKDCSTTNTCKSFWCVSSVKVWWYNEALFKRQYQLFQRKF